MWKEEFLQVICFWATKAFMWVIVTENVVLARGSVSKFWRYVSGHKTLVASFLDKQNYTKIYTPKNFGSNFGKKNPPPPPIAKLNVALITQK